MNEFLRHAQPMTQDPQRLTGRALLAHRVNLDRTAKFKTLDAARIEAEISRGSWEKVEKGVKVRGSTLRAVERALGWPTGQAQRIIEGQDTAGVVYEVPGDFIEWARTTDLFSEWQRRELLRTIEQMAADREGTHDAVREVIEESDPPQASPEHQSGAGA